MDMKCSEEQNGRTAKTRSHFVQMNPHGVFTNVQKKIVTVVYYVVYFHGILMILFRTYAGTFTRHIIRD
jgi:hypothetical protein